MSHHSKSDPQKESIAKSSYKLSYFEQIKKGANTQVGGTTVKGRELYLQVSTHLKDDLGTAVALPLSLPKY